MNNQIRFENISVRFDETPVLNDFSLTINPGNKIVVRGPSGSGKSTLLGLLLGVVHPQSGNIIVENKPLEKEAVWQFRKQLAYVPQNYDIGEGTVRSVIEEIFSFKANKTIQHEQSSFDIINTFMRFFDLDASILEKNFEELSGGEKQRVVIVLAIARQKGVYLLDEVTSSLDDGMKQKVADYFMLQTSATVITVSHDQTWTQYKQSTIIDLR